MTLVDAIDARIGEVRTESLDMSVGEIIGLHQQRELVIQPDFQRLFRWTGEQRSRLIESLLLELPIPSIFVIEKGDGVLELIDGLQRISSLLHFVDAPSLVPAPEDDNAGELKGAAEVSLVGDSLQHEGSVADEPIDASTDSDKAPVPLVLSGCDLVPELNGLSFDDLPLTLRLRLKRTPIRVVIIKRQSSQFLRYEMFKRLNTGGSKLSDQDIRNVNARMLGDIGAAFYKKIIKCASLPAFRTTIALLPDVAYETRLDEELVLRFFATKNFRSHFRGNVGEWLDAYMEEVLLGRAQFTDQDEEDFNRVFTELATKFGSFAFVKYRGKTAVGGVAPAYFEAVSIGALKELNKLRALTTQQASDALAAVVQSNEFRRVTGPGANSLPKLEARINLLANAFASA